VGSVSHSTLILTWTRPTTIIVAVKLCPPLALQVPRCATHRRLATFVVNYTPSAATSNEHPTHNRQATTKSQSARTKQETNRDSSHSLVCGCVFLLCGLFVWIDDRRAASCKTQPPEANDDERRTTNDEQRTTNGER